MDLEYFTSILSPNYLPNYAKAWKSYASLHPVIIEDHFQVYAKNIEGKLGQQNKCHETLFSIKIECESL